MPNPRAQGISENHNFRPILKYNLHIIYFVVHVLLMKVLCAFLYVSQFEGINLRSYLPFNMKYYSI